MDSQSTSEKLTGLSTKEALAKLSSDIHQQLIKCQCQQKNYQSFAFWLREAYHHLSISSTFTWPSCVLLTGESIIYVIAYFYGNFNNTIPLLIEGVILLLILLFNVVLIGWNTRQRHLEMHNKAKLLADQIKEYQNIPEMLDIWSSPHFYPHLHTPQSPCISLQWTFRDGNLINLPTPLLVAGDVILLCPGHSAPGKCRNYETIHDSYYASESNQIELESNELFVPSADNVTDAFTSARPRKIAEPVKFVMLETVYLTYLKKIISNISSQRPATAFEKELHLVLIKYIQRILIPLIAVIIFLFSCIHYTYLVSETKDVGQSLGAAITLVLLRTATTVLPILPVTLPLSWIVLNAYGIAYLLQHLANLNAKSATINQGSPGSAISGSFSKIKDFNIKKSNKEIYLEEIDSDKPTVPLIRTSISWHNLYSKMKGLLLANEGIVWRSSNMLQVLGSITALCCIDKKGILSWPNPTADKLFFLTSNKNNRRNTYKSYSSDNYDDDDDDDDDDEKDSDEEFEESEIKYENEKVAQSKEKQKKNVSNADCIQLDITHDPHNAYGLQFDDPEWKKFLANLKPLGLGILLNTCMKKSQDEYTKFCNHIACESLHNEAAVPVVNKRCLCELARQIGFTETAINGYEYEYQIALFRHVRPEVIQKGKLAKSLNFPRLKMPFPNMASAVIKDSYTNTYQLFSQGTGDLVLDACTEYWDGQDLCLLTDSDRKKILDFYQRTSLTAYCMAFSYVPLNSFNENTRFNDCYIELPPDSSHLFPSQKSLDSSLRSVEHHHQVFLELTTKSISSHHLSSDSILKQPLNTSQQIRPKSCFGDLHDNYEIESLMHQISNEVFIGMVTMQYQACPDFVQLVEQLENACIRFVHFSKENELRSRVFSEKMGLESGWNCHISLLNESEDFNVETRSFFHNAIRGSKSSLVNESQTLTATNTIGRSQSAPSSVNLEISTVKFADVEETEFEDQVNESEQRDVRSGDDLSEKEEEVEKQFKVQTNISPAPSRLTESTGTDHSAPITFDMSNRAKLPKGIENIRPHLELVDNVPLLVSLFTDCVPEATKEMIKIMQEYGEVVCVLGSSANFYNMPIFLQSDLSIGIEPMYPQVCITEPVREADLYGNSSLDNFTGPIDLAKQLITLPCSLSINREDSYPLYSLIMEARHYMMKMRNSFQFFLCASLSVCLAQLLSSMLFLPPIFAPGVVLWLTCIVMPILSASLMGTPFDEQVFNVSTGKNLRLSKETIMYFLTNFLVKFVPSIILTIVFFGIMISRSCHLTNIGSLTIGPCWMFSDVMAKGETEIIWSSNLLISQTFASLVLVIYLVVISAGFVNQYHLLWQKSPFINLWWIVIIIAILVFHLIVCIIEFCYVRWDYLKEFLSSIPIYAWSLAFLWPSLLVSINALMKRYEIKAYKRQQRRARLEFGTKLGMNSPF